MKRLLNIALMAATVCCLSLAVTSCKDDDNSENNNGNGSSEQAEQEPAAADRFWAVAANLVSPFDVTDDYADKTFEPTIGEPTDGNTTVRTVNATDIDVAAASFASITGTDISAETSTYTFHDDAVGTLTYNKSTDGKSLATVDVSIKQIPGLQRIVFKSQEQMGSNAVTSGVPYYSFGDVISRLNKDGKTEYWVCIHPAFTKQGISTSQWATLSPLPDENVWTYKGSNKKDYALPTKIGEHNKEMQQMAELTYALLNPGTWYQTAQGNGIKAFNDIKRENLQYINDIFWQKAQQQWSKFEIWQNVFGYSYEQMKDLGYADATKNTPLHFLGKGYSWHTTWSNFPTLFQYSYSNGTGKKSNMHNYQNKKVSKNVIANNIELNCQTQISEEEPYWINNSFFDDETPRYIFRTATGKELFGKNPDLFATMANNNGIKDVYVYNKEYDITVGQNQQMKEPNYVNNKSDESYPFYMNGDVLEDEEGSRWICIAGAPFLKAKDPNNQTAWFISFDSIKVKNGEATNIVAEKDLAGLTYRLSHFMTRLTGCNNSDFKYIPGDENKKGKLLTHILDFAGVDMTNLFLFRDSTWVFKVVENGTEKTYESNSRSIFTCIAYRSESTHEPLLCRAIYDCTQAGSERHNCVDINGKGVNNWFYRIYKHYETYNPSAITMTPVEVGFGNTKWNSLWPMTNEVIKLSDLKSQQMVDRHAKDDKWVSLPYTIEGVNKESGSPRTDCENDYITLENYIPGQEYKKFGFINNNMWNEPIMMIRLMKVIDKGGFVPNLVSTDGRQLKIVHLIDSEWLWKNNTNTHWSMNYEIEQDQCYTDNIQVNMPDDYR